MDFLRSGLRPSLRKSTVFYHKVTAILILFQLAIAICDEKNLLKKQIFSETFWFNNDGSPITDNDINIDWNSESINITIDSEEMRTIPLKKSTLTLTRRQR